MSRIGNRAIKVPKGVEIASQGRDIRIKGPKGELKWTVPLGIAMQQEDGQVAFKRQKHDKQTRALHGLSRAHINNMIKGVADGFVRSLKIEGVGYRAALKGKLLEISVGYSNPVKYDIPAGIEVVVEEPTLLHVKGIDKQQVGQVAAEIRRVRPPEPYKGKGIRYADEKVRRKAGKAAA